MPPQAPSREAACVSKRERIEFTRKHDLPSEEKSSRNRLADFYAAVAKRQQDRSRVGLLEFSPA
jgi:hypothetical protein